jgi:hypothetical protein
MQLHIETPSSQVARTLQVLKEEIKGNGKNKQLCNETHKKLLSLISNVLL